MADASGRHTGNDRGITERRALHWVTSPGEGDDHRGPAPRGGVARHLLEAVMTECASADHGLIGDLQTAASVGKDWF